MSKRKKNAIIARDWYSSASKYSKQDTTEAGRNGLRHDIPQAVLDALIVLITFGPKGAFASMIAKEMNKSVHIINRNTKYDDVTRWLKKAERYGCCKIRKDADDHNIFSATQADVDRWKSLPIVWVGTNPDGELAK